MRGKVSYNTFLYSMWSLQAGEVGAVTVTVTAAVTPPQCCPACYYFQQPRGCCKGPTQALLLSTQGLTKLISGVLLHPSAAATQLVQFKSGS